MKLKLKHYMIKLTNNKYIQIKQEYRNLNKQTSRCLYKILYLQNNPNKKINSPINYNKKMRS